MTRRFFSGSTLDQAVMMAARHYEIDPQELAYRRIEKRHGFLRTRKAVMIAVDPDQPRNEPAGAGETSPVERAAAPVAGPEPASVPVSPAPESPSEPGGGAADERDEPGVWATDEPESPATDEPESPATDEPEEDERLERAAPGAEAREPEPRDLEGDDELLEAAERATQTLLRFAGIDAEATARAAAERIEVEIEGPDESVLVVEGGKGLLSIQHLLPRMLRGLTGRSSFVRADSDGFHQQRKERLEALALREADAASRSGNPRTLPPMAPDERRLVHLALKDSPTVVTESRGTGLHKRVVIRPADGFDEPGDVEARHGF